MSIGSFKKDTALTKDDSRMRATMMPVSTKKILPTDQRIDSCTIEVIDRIINSEISIARIACFSGVRIIIQHDSSNNYIIESVCTIYLPKDKVVYASTVSVRPLYKIENRLRSKQPDTATNVKILRATKEQLIAREQARAEDTIEVIDRSISARTIP